MLGKTVAEAITETDAFIDEAILNGLSEIRIIHGIGTGKLRAGLHDHFRSHPNVAEFRLRVFGEGESGVTILTLNKTTVFSSVRNCFIDTSTKRREL